MFKRTPFIAFAATCLVTSVALAKTTYRVEGIPVGSSDWVYLAQWDDSLDHLPGGEPARQVAKKFAREMAASGKYSRVRTISRNTANGTIRQDSVQKLKKKTPTLVETLESWKERDRLKQLQEQQEREQRDIKQQTQILDTACRRNRRSRRGSGPDRCSRRTGRYEEGERRKNRGVGADIPRPINQTRKSNREVQPNRPRTRDRKTGPLQNRDEVGIRKTLHTDCGSRSQAKL